MQTCVYLVPYGGRVARARVPTPENCVCWNGEEDKAAVLWDADGEER